MERQGLESHQMNSLKGTQVGDVEFPQPHWGSKNLLRNPQVFFIAIPFPFHQEVELILDEAAVENPLYLVVFLSIYNLWWQGWLCPLTWERIPRS